MLKTGKLPSGFLEYLTGKYASGGNRVVVGSGTGKDAAVIRFGNGFLVAKTDPVTLASKSSGRYLVNVNANDIACMGAAPGWFIATLLLPEKKTTKKIVEKIFADVSSACKSLGISLCGGHCEVTGSVNRPVLVGAMFGEAGRDGIIKGGAKPGDDIMLTKGIAIEGTAIIAGEKEAVLKKKYPRSFIERAKDFISRPGISVVKDAMMANSVPGVRYMHDPTEGGLATGLCETAKACGTGLIVFEEKIPVFPETEKLCAEFGLDVMGTIASGALIIISRHRFSQRIITVLKRNKIAANIIGEVTEKRAGVKIRGSDGRTRDIKPFQQDEIIKILR